MMPWVRLEPSEHIDITRKASLFFYILTNDIRALRIENNSISLKSSDSQKLDATQKKKYSKSDR
jgi:hypothetical protein